MANGFAIRPLEELQDIIRAAGMDKGRGLPDKKVGNKGYGYVQTELLKINDEIPGVAVEVDERTAAKGDEAMVRVPPTAGGWAEETEWMTKRELRRKLFEEWKARNSEEDGEPSTTSSKKRRLSSSEVDELISGMAGM